jgi:signal transduction histidine kinase
MNRSARTWILFSLCILLGFAALVAVTLSTLRMERSELQARRKAAVEEKVRLALWRMDSALAPLVVQESGRPYFQFNAFYPAGRSYARMNEGAGSEASLIPSPLLFTENPYVLLHFQIDAKDRFSSPQVPRRDPLPPAVQAQVKPGQIRIASVRLEELTRFLVPKVLRDQLEKSDQIAEVSVPLDLAPKEIKQKVALSGDPQSSMNAQEFLARTKQASSVNLSPKSQEVYGYSTLGTGEVLQTAETRNRPRSQSWTQQVGVSPEVREGPIKPLWFGSNLVLARRVSVGSQDYLQGCWLDWPAIQAWLKGTISDLLPAAEFAASSGGHSEEGRLMAALPVRLVTGPVPSGIHTSTFSPIRLSLLLAWGCAFIASLSGALVLHRALQLSERRGAFVSAVTHELRTPLTTFRLYTEMLASDMVPDEQDRRSFLATLMAEADRLDHLVKNVLAYSRLESRRARANLEVLPLDELLERHQERLRQRAVQAGMAFVIDLREELKSARIRTDPSVVEQILFNLVDNACKYAIPAEDRTIHLEIFQEHSAIVLRVRDHGPGIAAQDRKRLFQPFSKSAREAAHTAPGVGLGLALSRNLARSLGGDLEYDATASEGAVFKLSLPQA